MTTRGAPGTTTSARLRPAAVFAARADPVAPRGPVRAPVAARGPIGPRDRPVSSGPRAREADLVVVRDIVPRAVHGPIAGPVPAVPVPADLVQADLAPAGPVQAVLDPPGHGPREGSAPIASVRPVRTVSRGRIASNPAANARRVSSAPSPPRFRSATIVPSAPCVLCVPIARSARFLRARASVRRCLSPRRSSRRSRGFAPFCSVIRRPRR